MHSLVVEGGGSRVSLASGALSSVVPSSERAQNTNPAPGVNSPLWLPFSISQRVSVPQRTEYIMADCHRELELPAPPQLAIQ